MNILLPHSWLQEYLDTPATPKQLKEYLSLCGPSIERINNVNGDIVYDIEITSNRVDMASVLGIAREAVAILPRFGIEASLKQESLLLAKDPQVTDQHLPLTIEDPDHLCNRLIAVVLENATVSQSPDWMKERLEKSGVRSLNNLIDVTNYVMLELGHPIHVFDYDRIKTHTLLIRRAKKDETFVTLDQKAYKTNEWDVIIDDGTGEIIDLPGIMGTANSVVTDQTKRVILFIESNDPVTVRRTSMHHAIRTYAATINEKHPDPELTKTAVMRGIYLLQTLAGATPASTIIDSYPTPSKATTILVSKNFITQRLGVELTDNDIKTTLTDLEFTVGEAEGTYTVTPPSYRQFDVSIPEDVVEEVARIYGYHNLPSRLMVGEIPMTPKPKDLTIEEKTKQLLKSWGYMETYSYSFISKEIILRAGLKPEEHLKVANPLTEEIEYMRRSLVPSILSILEKNQGFSDELRLFELSNIYLPQRSDLPDEAPNLVIATTESFLSLKGIIESLFNELGVYGYDTIEEPSYFLHPKKSGKFSKDGVDLGVIGILHPGIATKFNLKKDISLTIISMRDIVAHAHPSKKYISISQYPHAIEDLALIIPKYVLIGEVIRTIQSIDPLVKKVEIYDTFNEVITIRVTYQSNEKSIDGEEIQSIRRRLLVTLKDSYNIALKT